MYVLTNLTCTIAQHFVDLLFHELKAYVSSAN